MTNVSAKSTLISMKTPAAATVSTNTLPSMTNVSDVMKIVVIQTVGISASVRMAMPNRAVSQYMTTKAPVVMVL